MTRIIRAPGRHHPCVKERGESMSLEAITKIRQVEEGMEREKSDARAQVQKLAADAEREGRELLRAGAEKARAENAAAMERAQERAAKRREEILAKAAGDCAALRAEAGRRMDKAVKAILERVVER